MLHVIDKLREQADAQGGIHLDAVGGFYCGGRISNGTAVNHCLAVLVEGCHIVAEPQHTGDFVACAACSACIHHPEQVGHAQWRQDAAALMVIGFLRSLEQTPSKLIVVVAHLLLLFGELDGGWPVAKLNDLVFAHGYIFVAAARCHRYQHQ